MFGESEFKDNLTAGRINIYGTMKVSGSLQFDRFNLKGLTEICGNMAGELCDVKGELSVKGNCETERFHVTGCVDVSGLLNAGDIKLELRHDVSHVREIGGASITVKRKRRASFFNRKKVKLIADLIEGDQVYLENTEAAVVRGKEVMIGPGCSIGTIEYKNKCECDDHSKVEEKTKM